MIDTNHFGSEYREGREERPPRRRYLNKWASLTLDLRRYLNTNGLRRRRRHHHRRDEKRFIGIGMHACKGAARVMNQSTENALMRTD